MRDRSWRTVFKRIDIALQGGGAHGAFTWGVLDRLLEERRIEIEGISGTSAGSMNAVALARGLADRGPRMAQELLSGFWKKVSEAYFDVFVVAVVAPMISLVVLILTATLFGVFLSGG